MKVSTLLTQYLYQNKQLSLPGIGQFSISSAVTVPELTDKNYHEFLQNIEFVSRPSTVLDNGLVDFIRQKTGKIRPLAESDFESFMSDCKTMLNIGKPLYLEGIGTLQKNKEGRYDFVHGMVMSERAESMHPELPPDKHGEKKFLYRTEYTEQASQTNILRKLLIAAGIVIGLGVVVWGGYLVYTKKAGPDASTEAAIVSPNDTTNSSAGTAPDTAVSRKPDSTAIEPSPAPVTPEGKTTYKFICEVTKTPQRALNWFPELQKMNARYQMETRDSIRYTIFVKLPALPSDTTRIKDSLKLWYWGSRPDKPIRIEQ